LKKKINFLKFCERTKNLVKRIEGIKIHRIDQQLFNLVRKFD